MKPRPSDKLNVTPKRLEFLLALLAGDTEPMIKTANGPRTHGGRYWALRSKLAESLWRFPDGNVRPRRDGGGAIGPAKPAGVRITKLGEQVAAEVQGRYYL